MMAGVSQSLRWVVGYSLLAVALAIVRVLITHEPLAWICARTLAALTVGAVTGALGAALAGRSASYRALRLSRRERMLRGARWGAWFNLMSTTISWAPSLDLENILGVVLVAAPIGLVGGVFGEFLSPAEHAFARATQRLRRGDRKGAHAALREYVQRAKTDPLRAARLPAAEAFLAGTRDTLDVSMELEAAESPAGRGTEPEAAERPAGTGSELIAAAEARTHIGEAQRGRS